MNQQKTTGGPKLSLNSTQEGGGIRIVNGKIYIGDNPLEGDVTIDGQTNSVLFQILANIFGITANSDVTITSSSGFVYLNGISTNITVDNLRLFISASPSPVTNNLLAYDSTLGVIYKNLNSLWNWATKSGAYNISASDNTINYTTSGGTLTLPTAVGISGRIYIVKNTSASPCTLATTSSQTIDGSTTYSMPSQACIHVQSNGTNWIIIAGLIERNQRNTLTTTYTVLITDSYLLCNGTFTVTLLATNTVLGREFTIKNIGVGVVTVAANGSQTIDVAATQTLTSNQCIKVFAYSTTNGTAWQIVSKV